MSESTATVSPWSIIPPGHTNANTLAEGGPGVLFETGPEVVGIRLTCRIGTRQVSSHFDGLARAVGQEVRAELERRFRGQAEALPGLQQKRNQARRVLDQCLAKIKTVESEQASIDVLGDDAAVELHKADLHLQALRRQEAAAARAVADADREIEGAKTALREHAKARVTELLAARKGEAAHAAARTLDGLAAQLAEDISPQLHALFEAQGAISEALNPSVDQALALAVQGLLPAEEPAAKAKAA